MFRIILYIFAALILLPLAATAQTKLRIVTLEAAPMVMVKDGEIYGMAAELAHEALLRMDVEPQIEIAPWTRAVYMAKHGLADGLFYAVYNEERAKYFHYPRVPLFTVDIIALKRTKSSVIVPPDYSGLTRWKLGVGRGYSYGEKLQDFIEKARFSKVEETASNALNFKKLLDHRIDLLIADRALARYFIEMPEHQGKADFVRNEQGDVMIFDKRKVYLVFSKITTTALDAERLSKALESMKEDGSYQKIIAKYQ